MDSENYYKVTFNGELIFGADRDQVKANLARLFKSSEATIEKLFNGRTMTIKKNISKQQATNYQQAMEKAGAVAQVSNVESQPDIKAKPIAEPMGTEESPASGMVNSNIKYYTALPITNNLIEAKLAPPPVIVIDDDDDENYAAPPSAAVTDAAGRLGIPPAMQWAMREVGARMSKPKRPTTKPTPNTDYLDLSPPKTDVGQAKRVIEAVNPDISHLEMANTGTRLSQAAVKEDIEAPDTSYLNVAAVGDDMGQAKHEKELKSPDISQLSLDESDGNIEQLKHAKEVINPDISHLALE